ncbi:deoxycytidylate deaminase [Algivirga pacifica]|uniref:dCMP deaminase family protein n=1 Tax=Algivirga pacifica TaxID=1162670 RepID=A0ABP9DI32_9BACT
MTERESAFHQAYMKCAIAIGDLSRCERLKVGAIIVKDGNIISMGYNGTPKGFENCCEHESIHVNEHGDEERVLVTKREVLHAEANAITKAARSTYSTEGAAIYCTNSCCFDCAKLVIQSGISEFYYRYAYRDMSGVELLKRAGVVVKQID